MRVKFIGFCWGNNAESQARDIRVLAKAVDADLLEVFTQQDTGRHSKWEELEEAIYATRTAILDNVGKEDQSEVYLVFSTLEGKRHGLTRNVKVLSAVLTLLDWADVKIVFCDEALNRIKDVRERATIEVTVSALRGFVELQSMKNANEIKPVLEKAEAWKAAESERRKKEMQERMKQGYKPTSNLDNAARKAGSKAGNEVKKQLAKQEYEDIAPLMLELRGKGLTFRQIAEHLNEHGHKTRRGCEWTHAQVMRVVKRFQKEGG